MKISIILLMVVLAEVQSKELDPGPGTFTQEKFTQYAATQTHKQQAVKEITLYLTPSQINALLSGDTTINSFLPEPDFTEQDTKKQLSSKENSGLLRLLENRVPRIMPVQKPQEEVLKTVSETTNIKKEEQPTKTENQFQKYELGQKATLHKLQLQGPDQNESEIQRDAWIAYDSASDKREEESFEQFIKEWNRILELNRNKMKALLGPAPKVQKSEESEVEKSQNGTKHNEQKSAIEIEKLLRPPHQDDLNKQSALVQAEAIANSPPTLIHQEVTHRPVPVFRRAPVSTAASVPISESFKVNIPHTRSVPLQVFKNIPSPRGVEINGYELKKIPVSLRKQRTSIREDRPSIVYKIVPYSYETKNESPVGIYKHKMEKVTNLRQVWKH